MNWQQTVNAAGLDFEIKAEVSAPANITANIEPVESLDETALIRVKIEGVDGQHFYIHDFSVEWAIPVTDMHGLYFGGNPLAELSYLPFWHLQKYSCANSGLPYMVLIHRAGGNRAAFGLLDQITETRLTADLSELTRCYHMQFQKPANKDTSDQRIPIEGCHDEVLYVSRSQAPWPEVLHTYSQLVDQSTQPALMPVPDHAYDPVFCTWTAIHHEVSHEWIMRNAQVAADLGFRTWITDDGWFIEHGHFGDYSHAGDWLPNTSKFPDFRAHVKAVQALGFRYVLWVAPFMVGKDSQAAARYAHLLTDGQERERFNNYSPRHTETGVIISNLLRRLVDDYDLDGLKIDFLDSMRVPHNGKDGGTSDSTLGQGIYAILKQAVDSLLVEKPELLIEFRNSYANLASRSYANIYRSSDVPINFTLNRWQAVMLRLLAPDRAIHLDPALWHPDDTDENVAVHLINCLVSVPMVSIELDQYPASHLDLIRHWIEFYNAHRDTIVHGEFSPVLSLGHVPVIYFVGHSETIVGLYDDVEVSPQIDYGPVWILNASTRDYVSFSVSGRNRNCRVVTRDKFGRIVSTQKFMFPQSRLDIEVGGSLELIAE